jgi:hypothetical protein
MSWNPDANVVTAWATVAITAFTGVQVGIVWYQGHAAKENRRLDREESDRAAYHAVWAEYYEPTMLAVVMDGAELR